MTKISEFLMCLLDGATFSFALASLKRKKGRRRKQEALFCFSRAPI